MNLFLTQHYPDREAVAHARRLRGIRKPWKTCHSERSEESRPELFVRASSRTRARFLHFVQDRLFAEFTLSGRARSFAPLRMTSEGLRMTAKGSEWQPVFKADR